MLLILRIPQELSSCVDLCAPDFWKYISKTQSPFSKKFVKVKFCSTYLDLYMIKLNVHFACEIASSKDQCHILTQNRFNPTVVFTAPSSNVRIDHLSSGCHGNGNN